MQILRARLYAIGDATVRWRNRPKPAAARSGSGERSEKVRTYNFPQNRVTDHRIGLTLHRLDAILEGDLDEMIEALISDEQAERLAGLSDGNDG